MVAARTWGTQCLLLLLLMGGCSRPNEKDSKTVVVAIENSPNSLDPRVGTDAQSERIGSLLFDSLVRKDEHYRMQPWLALSWEQPDALTWIFHLRPGVRFADGRALGAEDAAWTIDSLLDGVVASSKAGAFASVARAEAVNPLTLRVRMKRPDASLLYNLSDGVFGVIPRGAGKEFAQAPVGSGPFRFVSATPDRDVVVERNAAYWQQPATLERVRFQVVPDAVTVALELEKGTVDVASNELTLDMVHALESRAGLVTETSESSRVLYLNFNCARGPLSDMRVRQALAFAMDRQQILDSVWRGQATPAWTLLPPGHWAATAPAAGVNYAHDVGRAVQLLQQAGYPAGKDGVRLRLEMKTSQDDSTRLLAQILQQQLRAAGIQLTLRAAEFGTFYADVTAGRFEMYALTWVGSNEDPDIFRYAYGSDRVPPHGGNRGHFSDPRVDALLAAAAATTNEVVRRAAYVEVQQRLASEVPSIPLWWPRNEVVHTARVQHMRVPASGNFDFLRDASLQ